MVVRYGPSRIGKTYLVLLHLCERPLKRLEPACSRIRNISLLNAANTFVRPAHTYADVSPLNKDISNVAHQ